MALSPLARELRDIAHVGLDDPSRLAREVNALLDLAIVVREAGEDADSLARAAALTRVLRSVFARLSAEPPDESDAEHARRERRQELLDGLFVLSDHWRVSTQDRLEPRSLTSRREELAGVGVAGDTTRFRRREEEPVYELVAELLAQGSERAPARRHAAEDKKPVEDELADMLDEIRPELRLLRDAVSHYVLNARFLQAHSGPDKVKRLRSDNGPDVKESLRHFAYFLTWQRDSTDEVLRLAGRLDDSLRQRCNWLMLKIEALPELDPRDMSLLRARIDATPEWAVFDDYLKSNKEGQRIAAAWLAWVESAFECDLPLPQETGLCCSVHEWLGWIDRFLALTEP